MNYVTALSYQEKNENSDINLCSQLFKHTGSIIRHFTNELTKQKFSFIFVLTDQVLLLDIMHT